MRRLLRGASVATKLVVTLALLLAFQGAALALWGIELRTVPGPLGRPELHGARPGGHLGPDDHGAHRARRGVRAAAALPPHAPGRGDARRRRQPRAVRHQGAEPRPRHRRVVGSGLDARRPGRHPHRSRAEPRGQHAEPAGGVGLRRRGRGPHAEPARHLRRSARARHQPDARSSATCRRTTSSCATSSPPCRSCCSSPPCCCDRSAACRSGRGTHAEPAPPPLAHHRGARWPRRGGCRGGLGTAVGLPAAGRLEGAALQLHHA